MEAWSERLGTLGVWRGVDDIDVTLAKEIERLGYGTIWQGRSPSADLGRAEELLDSTGRIVLATGIVNIWNSDAGELADSYHRIVARHPGRLLLGIGTGHREATPQRTRPIKAMVQYLDILDDHGVPVHDRVLSALGPRMLELAARRSAGTHPYLTVPSQTKEARDVLGADALIAPEQTVVLGTDQAATRDAARTFLGRYLGMSNYTSNMLRGGFTEQDITAPGSDRLVDSIVVQGDAGRIAQGIRAHLDSGADHVAVQVQPASGDILPALRALVEEFG